MFQEQVMELEEWAQSLSLIVIINRFVNECQGSHKEDEGNRSSLRIQGLLWWWEVMDVQFKRVWAYNEMTQLMFYEL